MIWNAFKQNYLSRMRQGAGSPAPFYVQIIPHPKKYYDYTQRSELLINCVESEVCHEILQG